MAEDLRTERKGRILAVRDLPTLPKVLDEVAKLVERPDSTTEEVAKLISMDQVLSAKVLKMVNSPVYGFPGRISSIQHALVLLGFNVLRSIIVSTSVFEVMTENMVGLWEHSLGCAMACGAAARMLGFKDAEEYSVAGLLHDVGRLVLFRSLPRHLTRVLATARAEGRLLREVERAMLGYDHAALGGMLLRRWRFPEGLEKAVRHHHGRFAPGGDPLPAAVRVADAVTGALGLGSSGEVYAPPLSVEAWNNLGLSAERLRAAITAAEVQIEDILRAFLPDEL